MRAFADGYMALLLPRYLTVLGFSALDIYPPACQHPVRVGSLHAQPVATGVTNVPRSFASALSPALAGYMLSVFSFGWLQVAGCRLQVAYGVCKIAYDLTLLKIFRRVKLPEESS